MAIDKRKIEAEGTNYTYSANLAWSIRALGTMCVEILPKLKSGPGGPAPGVARWRGEDDARQSAVPGRAGQTQAHY